MYKNELEITINAPISKVWKAITSNESSSVWMKNTTTQTDWKVGSPIIYTIYEENGKVMQWEGQDMIWEGNIEVLEENKEFTCVYPTKSAGLEKESYILEKIDDEKTKLALHQYCISEEVAEGYKEGMDELFKNLKDYLEK